MRALNFVFASKSGIGGPQSFVSKYIRYLSSSSSTYTFFPLFCSFSVNVFLGTPCFPNLVRFISSKFLSRKKHITRLDSFFSPYECSFGIFTYIRRICINVLIYIEALLSDAIVFQSTYLAAKYSHLFPFHKKFTIPNPYDVDIYDTFSSRLKEHSLFSSSRPRIFYVCIEGVVQGSFARTFLEHPYSINTLVFGDSSTFQNDKTLNSSPFVHYYGLVPKPLMYEIIFQYSIENNCLPIFICLEEKAACPNSVIESLAVGIPVIGLDDGSLPELLSSGCGLLLSSKLQQNQLVDSVVYCSNQIRSSYKTFSSCASLVSVENRSPKVIFDKYEQMVLSLL